VQQLGVNRLLSLQGREIPLAVASAVHVYQTVMMKLIIVTIFESSLFLHLLMLALFASSFSSSP
jgi:hypothetical protein